MNHATEVFQPLQADDPPTVAGYRLAARLGAGGMGRVYLSHTQGGRPVAIKVIRPELADDPIFRRGFRREIKAAQRVRGAYTAELIDGDADGVPPWLATLYVPGPSLADAVARRGPLPVPAVLWLMAGVAEALQAIHAAGIVHRDLKPSNVLLAADGPRVIDFGISLASGITSHTATGATVGTPQFMAPEQASGGEVTAATDVFALGQTAAFAALGEPLYGEGNSVGVLYRIVHSEPDLSVLPAQLRPLMARCLAADPGERATPAEIVEWCRQRLGGDADAGAGSAVWRQVMGPEVTVPSPVPHPTPVYAMPLLQPPQLQWRPQPTVPDERRAGRRRTRMLAVVVMVSSLLSVGVAWTNLNMSDRLRDRNASESSTSGQESSARSSASSSTSGASSGSGGGGRPSAGSRPSSAASKPPKPIAYPLMMLNATKPLDMKDPYRFLKDAEDVKDDRSAKERKADIRFVCGQTCALESDTSLVDWVPSEKPGATLESCRATLADADHRLPLAIVAAGSEICFEHPSGDIALFVVDVKSTALPDSGFVSGEMTVWRGAA
ncbi:serine/threonine protein kinase [Streptomyces phaeochromogenes]|jgi:eukaryotic-like serine/threonine-protein kinase|uniref:serine/threonine-protein kinase n=1 Tax=Streptomyces phaeochromogenes TaxID=1923 RepID=UPI002790352F|nr:serine/threonine-protein kinase [Streptomyces phaeochromogenes]MDQ0950506.1 serine/threonine protein kinase [Streptomyces phaeochromogenes]